MITPYFIIFTVLYFFFFIFSYLIRMDYNDEKKSKANKRLQFNVLIILTLVYIFIILIGPHSYEEWEIDSRINRGTVTSVKTRSTENNVVITLISSQRRKFVIKTSSGSELYKKSSSLHGTEIYTQNEVTVVRGEIKSYSDRTNYVCFSELTNCYIGKSHE